MSGRRGGGVALKLNTTDVPSSFPQSVPVFVSVLVGSRSCDRHVGVTSGGHDAINKVNSAPRDSEDASERGDSPVPGYPLSLLPSTHPDLGISNV